MTKNQHDMWEKTICKWNNARAEAIVRKLRNLSLPPPGSEPFNKWLEQNNALAFLTENAHEDWIVVYCTLRHSFVHAVFVPNSNLNPPNIDDLLSWNGNAYGSSWGVVTSGKDVWIEPLKGFTGESMQKGDQILFVRDFVGVDEHPNYLELLQKFAHVCELHFVDELKAWCRLDQGNKLPVVRAASEGDSFIVLMHRSILATYASLSRMTLVRMFDFPRYNPEKFIGWPDIAAQKIPPKNNIYSYQLFLSGYSSYSRGIQIIDIATPIEEIADELNVSDHNKKYQKFTILDWKNRKIDDVSCAPDATVNYFTKSNLPLELSPAFFDQEVLFRYKSNRKKYKVTEYAVGCRGSWSLPYGINAYGQISVYLLDLRKLPFKEQSYWKSFNENPITTNFNQNPLQLLRETLSEDIFKAHFLGSWEVNLGSLQSLKDLLLTQKIPWWKASSPDDIERLNYPASDSEDDWKKEIIALDQLLIEGLQHGWLQNRAKTLGCNIDEKWKSIKLLEQCLIHSGVDEKQAELILSPLCKLHELRNKSSHRKNRDIDKLSKQAIKNHGSYHKHYCHLVDTSREAFLELINRIR